MSAQIISLAQHRTARRLALRGHPVIVLSLYAYRAQCEACVLWAAVWRAWWRV